MGNEQSGDEGAGLVLLIGAPRSGTTWLQGLLGTHPAIVTPQETDLFARYIEPLDAAWRWQTRGGPDDWALRRYKGLPAVLTAVEFGDLVRSFAQVCLDGALRLKPGASTVLEKSPLHALSTDVVRAYLPRARFVHLVRDGRDVVASLVGASEGWGSAWAPGSIGIGARTWVEHVRGARLASVDSERYLEVRYEDLVRDGVDVLARVFEFCGVDATGDYCTRVLDEMSFDSMSSEGRLASSILVGGEWARHVSTVEEPDGFFRKGRVGGWSEEWSAVDRRRFAAVAGEMLIDLGYEPDASWVGPRSGTILDAAHRLGSRAAVRFARGLLRNAERWRERAP